MTDCNFEDDYVEGRPCDHCGELSPCHCEQEWLREEFALEFRGEVEWIVIGCGRDNETDPYEWVIEGSAMERPSGHRMKNCNVEKTKLENGHAYAITDERLSEVSKCKELLRAVYVQAHRTDTLEFDIKRLQEQVVRLQIELESAREEIEELDNRLPDAEPEDFPF